MVHSFIAYIDESGDDGLRKFRTIDDYKGSTQWLGISAVIGRYSERASFVKWRDEIGSLMPNRRRRDIHFKDLNDRQKLMAAQRIAGYRLRGISVLSNKTTIGSGVYKDKNQLYHYVTRHLVERVSWLCRDYRSVVPEGDGTVKLVFSKRGNMDYSDFQNYLKVLEGRSQTGAPNEIYWPVMDINAVEAVDHSVDAGLQIADCVASASCLAVEPDEFGNCWDRCARALKPIIYNRKQNYLSYGMKTLPSVEDMSLSEQQRDFFGFFAKK